MTAKWFALCLTLLLSNVSTSHGAVKFGSPFAGHMVLQRGKPIPAWGTADAGSNVVVTIATQKKTAKADAAGHWAIAFDAMPAGGPFKLEATSAGATIAVDDVLVGDVFLCSGQSNMQFGLHELSDWIAITPNAPPLLRLGRAGVNGKPDPSDSVQIEWSAGAQRDFSAVAYCFARELYKQDPTLAGVPIGLLEDCMGATVIESWMPRESLAGFDKKSLQMSMFGIGPSQLYNGMIAPLKNTQFAGVIWYQGEGNAGEPARYRQYLPLMIKSWRSQFEQPELPFLIVQLPDYAPDWGGVYWQWLREAQAQACGDTSHASYVVSINTNDGWNLHPQGKHEIARRLAMLARQDVYGEQISGRSPVLKQVRFSQATAYVQFDTDGSELTSGSQPIEGFEIAGDDGVYHRATIAVLKKPDVVGVQADAVPVVRFVRYAWAGVPRSTLTNLSGLPAAPFRTDDQPIEKDRGEIQCVPTGYQIKQKAYRLTIDGNGRATDFVVGYQQFLSNADGAWGGSNVFEKGNSVGLSAVTTDGPNRLNAAGGDVTESVQFDRDTVRWTITNRNGKEPIRFTLALASSVAVDTAGDGTPTALHRKNVAISVDGFDRVTTFKDPAADPDGKVLEAVVPAGGTREIVLKS